MFYRLKLSTAGRVDAVSLNPEILKCSDGERGRMRTMLPLGRYPEGGEKDGGGGNTADIENALPSAFAILGIFFGGEGPGLGIPDAESGKKRGGEKKVARPCNGALCNGRENRLVCLVVTGTTLHGAHVCTRMCVSAAVVAADGK